MQHLIQKYTKVNYCLSHNVGLNVKKIVKYFIRIPG